MNEIVIKQNIVPNVWLMGIYSPQVAKKAKPGQFVILRVTETGERIPLTIADFDSDKGIVFIIFQVVGKTTSILSTLNIGDSIADFVGPLGMPYEQDSNDKSYLFIAGGLGIPAIYSKVKMLHSQGKDIEIIVGGRSKENIFFEEELRKYCSSLYISTNDGSYGQKGLVTDILTQLLENGKRYDEIFAVGPVLMMKAVVDITKKYGIKTLVSLNPIMVDGTGMCGGCRVKIGNEIKFACVDGPIFNGFEVDFDGLMKRNSYYQDLENLSYKEHKCKIGLGE
ncbi:oxidoreductase FAD/NAD(P)-binding domain protein [Caldicellulosiruptor hydrothermalis 108]|uniref:Oxidoreductase FAD/NAD(P)-binding domain protein n=1 Tax=Caldicellulosiruptor hydrothermalis (strain DSM 18901 / VKM B-2411 / 108) TaxID=632292 RepID=E4QCE4_CALH1|nr:sulfide/dihydroorotate dehydrogenase-like FAD/NAD-binding protein [Caldicellulosiruptor hydrothermalis]ADQ06240.1 oxidoreductase FAD/NAD(P)-binding domain protein [Caldicellulosiruptor hydrothermalis 108]